MAATSSVELKRIFDSYESRHMDISNDENSKPYHQSGSISRDNDKTTSELKRGLTSSELRRGLISEDITSPELGRGLVLKDRVNSPLIQVLEKNEERIIVKMTGVHLSLMNSFRRNCIWEVETMCIENLEMFINTSNVEDEKIAHRLGLIPFTSQDVDKFLFADQCNCKNSSCEKCAVIYTLNVKNISPPNGPARDVTTLDLKPKNESTTVRPCHTDENSKDDEKSLYICSLYPGQELSFRVIVRKGTAKREQHHKFQPVSVVGLKGSTTVVLDQKKLAKLTPLQKKTIIKEDRDKIFHYDEKLDLLSVVGDAMDCIKCKRHRRCEEVVAAMGQSGAIKLVSRDDYYLITINSNGSLAPEQILLKAMERFLKVLEDLHLNLSLCGSNF